MKQCLVVVVAYNSAQNLARNLPGILASGARVMVVDNASSDDSLERARSLGAKTVGLPKNMGYARAINYALKIGLRGNYKYFAILNPDVAVSKDWLRLALRTFRREKAGIVQPLILLSDEKSINTSGNALHFLGFSTCRAFGKPKKVFGEQKISVSSGAAMVIKRQALEDIGFFENSYFLYNEDTQYSIRTWKIGWRIYLSPSSIVLHDYSLKISKQKWFWLERNRLANIFSLYHARTLIVIAPFFVVSELALIVVSVAKGLFWAKMRAYGGIYLGLSLRSNYARSNKVREKQVEEIFSDTVDFDFIRKPWRSLFNFFSGAYYKIVKLLW